MGDYADDIELHFESSAGPVDFNGMGTGGFDLIAGGFEIIDFDGI